MTRREVADMAALKELEGEEVAVSGWIEVTQQRIQQFADATGDAQWIHVDVLRCWKESPFGAPIAHGYLTLSLIPYLLRGSLSIQQPFAMTVNYGLNRLRFPHPVRVGSRLRGRFRLIELVEVEGGWQARWGVTIEIDGVEKPACVAETILRYFEAAP